MHKRLLILLITASLANLGAIIFAADPDVASPISSYQFLESLNETPTNPTVASNIVSYRFVESLSEQPTNPTVVSPIVSYQYFEWPGDANLTFECSAVVSYFYQVGVAGSDARLHGCVCDSTGTPVEGATVSASILEVPIASVQTTITGNYELPALGPGVYVVSAAKTGYSADKRVVALTPILEQQNFRLRLLPSLPDLRIAGTTPPFILPPPDDLEGAGLRVFDGTRFVPDLASIDRSKMTVALTHGWILCAHEGGINYWPTEIAHTLRAHGLTADRANIVGWDWHDAARPCLPPNPPEEKTPRHGVALGKALYEVLGADYAQKLHFVGHSLGTVVNAHAANYLHGHASGKQEAAPQQWSPGNTHMTLLDEAELARVIGKDVFYSIVGGYFTGGGLRVTLAVAETIAGWKSPVPVDAAWVDNYVSLVGFYRPDTVNVCLQKAIVLTPSFVDAHSYPQAWYSNTIVRPTASAMGFRRSFEYRLLPGGAGTMFPPPESEIPVGEAYHQQPEATDELLLEPLPYLRIYECMVPAIGVTAEIAAEFVVDKIETGARKVGEVTVEVVDRAAVAVNRAVNSVVDGVNDAGRRSVDLLHRATARIHLRTRPPPRPGGFRPASLGGMDTNTAAYVWLPIAVPADAVALAFDFIITGDGKDDSLVFGINDTNLFALQTKFVADGEVSTSRLIDVSLYAGKTNDFFFGVLGGTSTNCTVTIEGIRFFTLASPALTITHTNDTAILSWPSSANGFVLESTPSLESPLWSVVTNAPALFDGRFSVMNPWPNEARFFRLSHK